MPSMWATAGRYHTSNGTKSPNRINVSTRDSSLSPSAFLSLDTLSRSIIYYLHWSQSIFFFLFSWKDNYGHLARSDNADAQRTDNSHFTIISRVFLHVRASNLLRTTIFTAHAQMWMQICPCPFSGGELKMCWKWESRMECGREGGRERDTECKQRGEWVPLSAICHVSKKKTKQKQRQ